MQRRDPNHEENDSLSHVTLTSCCSLLWSLSGNTLLLTIVATDPLSPPTFQLPVTATNQHTTDGDRHLSPPAFQLPVAAAG